MAVNDKKKLLVIPVEVTARELQSRLLLAHEAVSKGCRVMIGAQREIWKLTEDVTNPVYFDKSVATFYYDKLKAKDMIYVACDEEALNIEGNEWYYLNKRHSDEAFQKIRSFFCWGEFEREAISKAYPDHGSKCFAVGNCRADIWRDIAGEMYLDKSKEYKDKYGEYVFIPMSYPLSSNHKSQTKKFYQKIGVYESDRGEQATTSILEFMDGSVGAMIELVKDLAEKYPDKAFVVRPHPSDWIEAWEEIFHGSENVNVIFDGVVGPWIQGSSAVLHSFCTSGIEAYFMKKPVISYCYSESHSYSNFLSGRLGVRAVDFSMVDASLEKIFRGDDKEAKISQEGLERISRYINCANPAFREIMKVLLKYDDWLPSPYPEPSIGVKLKRFTKRCRDGLVPRNIRDMVRVFLKKEKRVNPNLKAFPIREEDVRLAFRQFSRITGLQMPESIRRIGDEVFVIQ